MRLSVRLRLALVGALAPACSGAPSSPDAGLDSRRAVDAAPQIDARASCPAGYLCLAIAPVDGVTALPAGRLAIAWEPVTNPDPLEIAFDASWNGDAVTMVPFSSIADPSPTVQLQGPCGPGTYFARATAVLSTDPDGNGAITSAEIRAGLTTGDTYGIHQEIITWEDVSCGPMTDFPEGFDAGTHVYSDAKPVMKLDGSQTAMQTCAPKTVACSALNDPY
jgi:hypothetical protein